MPYHWITSAEFDTLAATQPDAAIVNSLQRARLSRVLLLMREIAVAHPEYDGLVRVLSVAQDTDRDAVSTVLGYPWVGVWAARCVRLDRQVDTAHFRTVVAAAALRAGLGDAARDLLRVRHCPLVLPTLGLLGPNDSDDPLRLDTWTRRLRTVRLDAGTFVWTLTIDDLDPYRDCHGTPAEPRLDGAGWRRWRQVVRAAWDLLRTFAGARAMEIAVGLRSVVPLASAGHTGMSVTHGDAFGGFGATYTASSGDLAGTMVHELAHSKLNSLLDRVPLYRLPERPAYFAPWRPDPRPLSGMIQGLAAFIAVAEMWHAFRAEPRLERTATARFALLRAQISRALAQVTAAPGLTAAGERFVAGLDFAATRLMEYPVPQAHDRAAQAIVASAEERWRQRWR